MKKAIYISLLVVFISCNNRIKETNPQVILFNDKGFEYLMETKKDSAEYFFKKALEIDSLEISTYDNLVNLYWMNDEPKKALKLLKNAPEEVGDNNSILILKGRTLEKLNLQNQAMKLYQKAFDQSEGMKYKNEENIMEYVGHLFLQAVVGEKEKALANLEKLKSKKLTETEREYIRSVEPYLKNYSGGGFEELFN